MVKNRIRPVAALAFALLLVLAPAASAADAPHAPRLAAGNGVLAGGFQTASEEDGAFHLFSAKPDGDDLRPLGQFHGRLSGVALDADGTLLALTHDGSLARYGDDVEQLARPDARWNMAALFLADGAPLAFTNDNGLLYPVRPGKDGEWIQDDRPVADIGFPARVDGLALPDGLHLFALSFAEDLSRGAWRELPPLPSGDAAAIAVLPAALPRALFAEDVPVRPGVVTLRRDPILPERARLSFHAWNGSAWTRLPLPDGFEPALADALFFTAATDASGTAWLVTGDNGAFLTPTGGTPESAALRVGAAPAPESGWSALSGPVTLIGLVLLAGLYCRRSRALSRALPGQPPDLFSRGAALAVDWGLVSLLMSGYHIANGDIHILHRLLNLEDVQTLFWANLAGLAAFIGVFEILSGRTPGKHLAGLRVRSVFGGPATVFQLLLRNVFRAVDMFPLPIGFPGLIGAAATFFGPRRQRVGDRAARTVVLRHCPLPARDFLLASASPRRLELLGALRLSVRTEAMDVDESIPAGEDPAEAVRRLSLAKARAASGAVRPGEIIIAADTVVVLDGRVLGKPVSPEDAKIMLTSLAGRSHSVFTGVTVWDTATGQGVTEHEETEVEFRPLTEFEINAYIASGEPMDKAGAYGVQSGNLVRQVRGSLSNVAGLPMEKLRVMLAALDS